MHDCCALMFTRIYTYYAGTELCNLCSIPQQLLYSVVTNRMIVYIERVVIYIILYIYCNLHCIYLYVCMLMYIIIYIQSKDK